MVHDAFAQNDIHRVIKCLYFQMESGKTLADSVENLKCANTIAAQKVEFIQNILQGQSIDLSQISPYKTEGLQFFASFAGKLVGSGLNVKDMLKAMNSLLITNRQISQELWKGIKGISFYFIFIIFMAVTCTGIYSAKVLPQLITLFDSLGGEMPQFTQLVLELGYPFFTGWLFVLLIIVYVVCSVYVVGIKVSALAPIPKQLLYVPGLKKLYRLHSKFRFMSLAEMFVSAGMVGDRALIETEMLLKQDGSGFDLKVFDGDGFYTDLKLASALGTLSYEITNIYEGLASELSAGLVEFRNRVTAFAQVLLACVVGVIVTAMYLPLFQIGQAY